MAGLRSQFYVNISKRQKIPLSLSISLNQPLEIEKLQFQKLGKVSNQNNKK